jgi:hypothetical protein
VELIGVLEEATTGHVACDSLFAAEPISFTAAFLVVDVRGWSKIVRALGPDPQPAAKIIQRFWDSAAPVVAESGGQVYAWRGDGLLVAYRGSRRLERVLKTAERLLALVRDELAPDFAAQLRAANAETLEFTVSAAITDGQAVPVPVRFGLNYSEELTGDWVNAAFEMVKWVATGSVGTTWEISEWIADNGPVGLPSFSWQEPEEIPFAGAVRRVRQGIPAVGPAQPGAEPPPGD